MRITAERYHDISCGHRVYQHESKCANAHGHNYRVHFTVDAPALDAIGRVLDFSVIKSHLCMWLEDNWDHKFLLWQDDPWSKIFPEIDPTTVIVPFNPTAENIADHLVNVVAPMQLKGTGARLIKCTVEETRKCAASCEVSHAS